MRILFFGRKNDPTTQRCVNHLVGLGFEVDSILSNSRNEPLPDDLGWIKYDYIICYRSYFILPKFLLDSTKHFNINFHPGSPKYPGSGGINLALLNGDKEFGVTAHLMDEKVDAGQIIECRNFNIKDSDDLLILLDRTHDFLFCLFLELTTKLSEHGNQFINESIKNNCYAWSEKKTNISEIDKLQTISANISKSELENRIRSLNHPNFPLEVNIHDYVFTIKGKI